MNVPVLGKVESVVVIGGLVIVGYLVYRLASAGNKIKDSVAQTVSDGADFVNSGFHAGELALRRAKVAVTGPDPAPIEDQSDAETARLQRAAGGKLFTPKWVPAAFGGIDGGIQMVDDGAYDALGNYIGVAPSAAWAAIPKQVYAPDAGGSIP